MQLSCGYHHSACVLSSGEVIVWAAHAIHQQPTLQTFAPPKGAIFRGVACGGFSTAAIALAADGVIPSPPFLSPHITSIPPLPGGREVTTIPSNRSPSKQGTQPSLSNPYGFSPPSPNANALSWPSLPNSHALSQPSFSTFRHHACALSHPTLPHYSCDLSQHSLTLPSGLSHSSLLTPCGAGLSRGSSISNKDRTPFSPISPSRRREEERREVEAREERRRGDGKRGEGREAGMSELVGHDCAACSSQELRVKHLMEQIDSLAGSNAAPHC